MPFKEIIKGAFAATSQTAYGAFHRALRDLYTGHVVTIVRALEAVAAENVEFPIAAMTTRCTPLKAIARDGVSSISMLALHLEEMAAAETVRELKASFGMQANTAALKQHIRDAVYDFLASDDYTGCLTLPYRGEDGPKRYSIGIKEAQAA